MSLPDILLFMSDQHTPYYSGFEGHNTDTPALDRLCRDGLRFSRAYTPCPLCVPSRAAMLSGLRPAATGVFTLTDALPDMTPTFLHYLVEQGYETVLAGRMHFVGNDQRHGFTRRIADDMTAITWNAPREKLRESRGVTLRSFGEAFCMQVIGGGESPVEYYDEYVTRAAVDYLSRPHEKPQFIVVGTYAPHFPYVGEKELYEKYLRRAVLPPSFDDPCPTKEWARHHQFVSAGQALAAQAAYCAMIEQMDERIGRVREAFDRFCDGRGSGRLFVYTSDHGDQVGDRRMFGKSTFYEKSVKIPLIMAGDGIPEGAVCDALTSIMDIGPTLLDYTGAKPMQGVDGVSMAPVFSGGEAPEHAVYAEFMERPSMALPADSYCFMALDGDYKYICFEKDPDCELLYNVVQDPDERVNLAGSEPEVLEKMRALAAQHGRAEESVRLQGLHWRYLDLWKAYEKAAGTSAQAQELWLDVPASARNYPEIMVGKKPE